MIFKILIDIHKFIFSNFENTKATPNQLMKDIKLIVSFSIIFFFTFSFCAVNAQKKIVKSNDMNLKEAIYNENRVKVLNFSMKEFDRLFFYFFYKK